MLTGFPVFQSSTIAKLVADHMHAAPVSPSERVEHEIPTDLEQVVLKCLEKWPDDRPQSAEQLFEMLAACETGAAWTPERARDWWDKYGSRHNASDISKN